MALSREVKTGMLAVFAMATLVLGYNYLKGTNLFKRTQTFYVVYDTAEGISDASAVTISGLKVGKVQEVFLNQNTGKLVVTLDVEKGYKIPKNTLAKSYGGMFIGGKSIALIPDYSQKELAKNGDTLRGEQSGGIEELVSTQLGPLQNKLEHVLMGADSLLLAFNQVLDTTSRADLKASIANFNSISASFKRSSAVLEEIVTGNKEQLQTTITHIENTAKNFSSLSDSLAQLEINTLIKDLEKTVANFRDVSNKLNSNEGSIGKLLNDEQLYDNLEGATRQLEQLLQDMKLNPKRYVHFSLFGKKPGSYQQPENSEQ